jgi:general secretion pathway protein D
VLRLRNVPLAVALKYICDKTKLRYKVDEFAVTLVPQTETTEDLFTRTFNVPPDFAAGLGGGAEGGGGGGEVDPFAGAGDGTSGAAKLVARRPIIELLKGAGIAFPAGSSASLSATGVLLITNTPTELDKIEQLVDAGKTRTPKQVKITTKFVEISQENSDELGFDWIVSPFGLGGDGFLSGGTIGSGTGRTNADFLSPVGGSNIGGVPTGPGSLGQNVTNILTGGLRSGDAAINRNSIDAILNNPNRSAQNANVAPGILTLTGVFGNSEVQMIMRGLAQKKGTDLMTAPSVTARSGQKATIEIIREFIYPTEYEPPELPNSVGANGGGTNPVTGAQTGGIFPVTPATPTAFETRNTGVTLEIEPTIGDNDFVIDLRFVPEIVEFEGFINYGSPIQSPSTDALGNPTSVTITENRIEMPVFSSRRVNTSLTIYDGYTVAVGGLMREDVQNVEDKVPILGDIPIIGRLFQSKAENRIKSNLIIFVTAQIIDATGRPLRGPDAGTTVPGGITAPVGGAGDIAPVDGMVLPPNP